MKNMCAAMLWLALTPVAAATFAGEGAVSRIEKRYDNGSAVAMTCARIARGDCTVEVSLEGVSAHYRVDFASAGEVPTMEYIALLNHSSNPFGGTLVVSVQCAGRADAVVPADVHSVQCAKYVYLSGHDAISWGSTLVMGRLEPVEIN